MRHVHTAIALSVILLSSSLGFNAASAATSTSLSLNSLSGFPVTQGETLVFSGRLIKSTTLTGVANATVNIVHQISFDNSRVLVSASTDADGSYSIPWVVDVEKVAPQTGGSFGTDPTQGREKRFQVNVFAQFDGDNEFARSTSNAQSFEVRLNQIKVFVERKTMYFAFESITIKIRTTNVDGNLIDPDKLTVLFDNAPVTFVRDSIGIYSFTISSLSPGSHSLKVVAEKKGHVTDEQLVTIEGMKRRTAVVINTDKKTYAQEETATITAELLDINTSSLVTGKPVTGSLTAPDLKVNTLTFVGGKATYRFTKFDATGTWSVSANFAGDSGYFSSSSSASFTLEKGITGPVTPPRIEEKVSLGSIDLVDQRGSRLSSISVGQQVMIQARVASNFSVDEEIAYISQVKDANGITVALSWITGTISPGQSLELAVSWLPDKPGRYTAEVFVWKDLKTPEPLSFEVKRSTIIVS